MEPYFNQDDGIFESTDSNGNSVFSNMPIESFANTTKPQRVRKPPIIDVIKGYKEDRIFSVIVKFSKKNTVFFNGLTLEKAKETKNKYIQFGPSICVFTEI